MQSSTYASFFDFPILGGFEQIIQQSGSFNIGAKATGEKFSKSVAGPPAAKPPPKDRKPDFVIADQTTPEQAIIYRLSGDYNPLHIGELFSISQPNILHFA